ncbi:hypothetical protein ACIBCA_23675 [Kitasatospora sp. NPDC051170]|uniref:hypothetical protein n=1 Tax=Kitasatospora sp. NPDC051170 TaxID=3364056 RepID=UPI0037AD7B86
MHESSTAGGGDETPREDGTPPREDGTVNGGTEPGGGVTRPPADGTTKSPGADAAEPAPEQPAQAAPRRTPERSQAEQDEIFAALIAQFDDPVDLNNPNWPEVENLRAQNELKSGYKDGPDRKAGGDDFADLAPQPRPRSGKPVVPAATPGPRDFELSEESDEGHFVPPEPPPLPAADVTAKFAWLAVLGGPALLLVDAVVWQEVSGWPAWVGITAFLGGFVTLVARMKDRDEDEPEDPNHGAVV